MTEFRINKTIKRLARIVAGTMAANLLFSFIHAGSARAVDPANLNIEATSAILIEASTGQVLYEMNADEPRPPASMAKMMTEYLVMDAVKSGKISMDDVVTVSKYASEVIGSGDMLAEGEKLTVRDLFYAMSIYSANDATVALAEFLGGTEENFVKMMNETAKKMGFNEKSQFINSTGLSRADLGKYAPTSIQGETLMTARDAAILARHIVNDHPEVLEFSKIPSKKLRPTDKDPMINWNWMLEGNAGVQNFRKYVYPGVDGLKTGHTDEAGYCFTGTAERNGMRLISVVMNTASMEQRFLQTQKLFDYGFNNFELKTVIPAKSEIDALKTIPVKKGVKKEVPVVTDQAVRFVVKKGENPELSVQAEPLAEIKSAPIKQGDVLGTVKVTYNGVERQVNLIAAEDMGKASWIRLFFRGIQTFFVNIFNGIGNGLKNLF